MSCPYAHMMSNGNILNNNTPAPFTRQTSHNAATLATQISNVDINNNTNHYDEDGDTSDINEQFTTPAAVDDVEHPLRKTKEPLNYISYLHLDSVLNGVHPLSHIDPFDENSPPVHDEHFFIIIHQIFELWFKAFLFEIDSIRKIFECSSHVVPQLFFINLRLNRSVSIWNMLIDMLQRLETMTPVEFLAFRDYVTPASGFQSLQFRIIEIKLGLTDRFRPLYQTNYFTGKIFKDQQARELEKAVEETSLLILVERWLEYVYDSTTSFEFLEVFTSTVNRFIEHTKNQKIANGVNVETAETQAKVTQRQFSTMLDRNEYNELLKSKDRRLSHKAMLAAVMISLYHQQPCFQQSYQMLHLLMDVDALMASWRHKHILLVQRQIGHKPGTGGTAGFFYLYQTISEKYQVFIGLFNVSSYLIPQHFLPKLFG